MVPQGYRMQDASPMVQTPVPLGHLDDKGGLDPRTVLLRDLRKGSDFVFGGRKKKVLDQV